MNLGKDQDQDQEKSALEKFGVDLTSKARDGKLDPVIGRDSVRRCLSQGFIMLILRKHGPKPEKPYANAGSHEPAYPTSHSNSFQKKEK